MTREGAAVWLLAIGQTIGYACFFYLFAALVLVWQRDLPFGHGLIAAGPLISILVTAVLSPKVGRWVDRGFAFRLMTGGTILGAGSLGLLALSDGPVTYLLAFAGMGAAAAMTLYEVCFALLIRRFGDTARQPITQITMVAGLASTLAFPAGAVLAASYGWRGAVWSACALVVFVMLPLQAWGSHVLGEGRRRGAIPVVAMARWRDILARPGALRLMLVLALVNLDHWMLMNLLRPLFADMGLAESRAILAASVIGPAQVVGRIVLLSAGARLTTRRITQLVLAGLVAAAICLLFAGMAPMAVFGFAIIQGAAMGVMTILRPLLVAEVNGPADYAAAAAALSLPAMAATAVAAVLGTWLLHLGGPVALVTVALGLALGAAALLWRDVD